MGQCFFFVHYRYAAKNSLPPFNSLFEETAELAGGIDVSLSFKSPDPPSCQDPYVKRFKFADTASYCDPNCLKPQDIPNFFPFQNGTQIGGTGTYNLDSNPQYSWKYVSGKQRNMVVFHNNVLNFKPYLLLNPMPISNDPIDDFIRKTQKFQDITRFAASSEHITPKIIDCLTQKYYAGRLHQESPTCMISFAFMTILFITISGIMVIVINNNS